ncbi:MAG: transporter substrate-binding domain-containing protein [Bacteroidales bacterium]|nr:transporter substrate-binding domain-containing protein [Bacteroidales bacterium]MCF8333496.1 transporter substrate-binding domain-containing protein [Bacteroidales bacterium]
MEFPQHFCFAVKKNNDSLLTFLNEGLSLVMADGTFRRLRTKWFSKLNRFRLENLFLVLWMKKCPED